MNNNEIVAFLLPGDDPIQIIFGSSILVLGVITLAMMFWGARRTTWEKKWNGSGADDLDVEHGSLNEISAAVASTGEKMADIMPGILLILGLLGTFLGLGLALDKASTILIEANVDGGMDNAMIGLMGMMEGLGTKFKTSTWGLIAFLVIKGFASLSGYDERRLRWCIGKMKAAFEQGRQAMLDSHERDQKTLFSTLSKIDQTLQVQLQTGHNLLKQYFQLRQSEAKATDNALSATRQAIVDMQQALLSPLKALNDSSNETCRLLGETTTLMQHHSKQNQQQLEDSHATRISLESFIEANRSNLSAISEAANLMAGAAGDIGQSAGQLKGAITEFESSVGEVLGSLKHDLADTIDNMGTSFSSNMSNISTTMAVATSGISDAVSDLSENVGKTMGGVQKANEQSIEIQKKAQGEFLVTSESLIGHVVGMTELVGDLRERIVSGLKAVSDNGRRMVSLDRRYADVVEKAAKSAEAINQLVEQLKDLQLSSPLQPAMETMTQQVSTLGNSLANIDRHILGLKNGLEDNDHEERISHLGNAMAEVIKHLESIDSHLEKVDLENVSA